MAILSISKNDNNNNNNNSNTEFQKLFLRRINIDENKRIEFEDLPEVMRQFGLNIPFENSDVIGQEPCGITKQLMYFFLVECGFHVRQLVATVWNPVTNKSWATPNGHCIAMITYDGNDYLVDVGFGLFLALAPIPFKTVVFSRTGEYRWIPRPTEYGTHSLEWRPSPDEDFRLGYSFTMDPIDGKSIDNIQRLIHGDTHKEFNSIPLSTILLEPSQGQATISGNSFTITKPNGEKVKELISNEKRQELLETIFKFKKK
ncbi:arylamine N-acetyltransferase family protein [Heterostelium album PN500]|uniref:Arylamine N-acetyltransferase family protein n=1 Tax=Heterostelium pallidum (strain ATCC 26659 / Pp 5 / PN500) TaxID=670386 RepID=D3BMJ7_HETP5|nr:arylamine N-acetyltransferase family protein [Heterostelium album PN500]EFA77209.1 arylamine N-acetyltransferase family protein [Heterostelium album PN500]|eukprot:XP_020429338.1 arylamine N-acetyltransferase family protein [Heterostelium album PN500]